MMYNKVTKSDKNVTKGNYMKIKVIKKNYQDVLNTKAKIVNKITKPNIFWRTLIKIIAQPDLKSAKFEYEKIDMDKLGKKEPALILMNHSSFIDLEIAESIFYPRPLNIVCTNDGFIGKNWLMRQIGCIQTPKFVNDSTLVRKLSRVVKMKSSILMFPEAGYSLDGTMTTFPLAVAKLAKFLKIPIVTVITDGAYLRQPLYNELRKRKIKVTAKVKYLISKEDMASMTDEEIYKMLLDEFSFDNFKNQQKNNIIIDESERAVGLNKVLYKCPHCLEEKIASKSDTIYCTKCNATYQLTKEGYLKSLNNETKFNHIPDWFKWQREEVRKDIENNKYLLDEDVKIYMMKDTYKLYDIGEGHLKHDINGFHLTGCDGELDFILPAIKSYSVNSDYFWYQIDDVVSIGDYEKQFYCFIKGKKDVVTKIRLATEEIYKIIKKN